MKFKTNIKCGGCVAKVTPLLNETVGENAWSVDTASADKVLTIAEDKALLIDDVIKAVAEAGFRAIKL
jgi:copper chaperone